MPRVLRRSKCKPSLGNGILQKRRSLPPTSRGDGGYDVRIFTPAAEVPFAGHPTLGTGLGHSRSIMRDEIASKPVDQVTLNLQVGQIPVTFDGDVLWMKQIQPEFGQTRTPAQVAPLLGLARARF